MSNFSAPALADDKTNRFNHSEFCWIAQNWLEISILGRRNSIPLKNREVGRRIRYSSDSLFKFGKTPLIEQEIGNKCKTFKHWWCACSVVVSKSTRLKVTPHEPNYPLLS